MSEGFSEGLQEAAVERLELVLQVLSKKGVTQSEVARRTGISSTYLADLKSRRRPIGELVARRLGEAFDLDFRWILGQAGSLDSVPFGVSFGSGPPAAERETIWLPLVARPVDGPAQSATRWDGSFVPVSGIAAARAHGAALPYVLRFGASDRAGELKKGDLLLISQAQSESATIHVVRAGRGLYLARRTAAGWERLAEEEELDKDVPVRGHVLGVLWRRLV